MAICREFHWTLDYVMGLRLCQVVALARFGREIPKIQLPGDPGSTRAISDNEIQFQGPPADRKLAAEAYRRAASRRQRGR